MRLHDVSPGIFRLVNMDHSRMILWYPHKGWKKITGVFPNEFEGVKATVCEDHNQEFDVFDIHILLRIGMTVKYSQSNI